jgi:anti-sigma factor RsiW
MLPDREVAGIRCSEVLADLSSYLDGELPAARKAQLEAHVAGCDVCARFGGRFSALVLALKRELNASGAVDADAVARMRRRLTAEL